MAAKIIGWGSHVPEKRVTNFDLAKLMNTSDEWVLQKIGIKERRYVESNQGTADLALEASKKALAVSGLDAKDIDAIVFATSTPDFHAPGSGALLQHRLGCRNIPAFDVRNTSPGFVYALDLADGLLGTIRYQKVLVVGAEVHSTGLDFSDRGRLMSVIFGDGAGCLLLEKDQNSSGFEDFILHTEGQYFDQLWCEAPSSLQNPRFSEEHIKNGACYPTMNGRVVFDHATKNMTSVIKELLIKNKCNVGEIDHFLFHQANARILDHIKKELQLSDEQVPSNIELLGNTSSASIPILYDTLARSGQIKAGEKVVMTSFGAGFCWGSALYQV